MNTKIFALLKKNLLLAFNLPKYAKISQAIDETTMVDQLPWTPARYRKFKDAIAAELSFDDFDTTGILEDIVNQLDQRYLGRFFGEIWKPSTDIYQYSGWGMVEEINAKDPKSVLDFGCGYNPFKGRIKNLVGIDPYNNCADYMVDILDFKVEPESFDHIIAFGSLNFNGHKEIYQRFSKLVEVLMSGGKMYFRANPGIRWPNAVYVDIFPWTFEIAYDLAQQHNLTLETFKKDSNNRLYFVYVKK